MSTERFDTLIDIYADDAVLVITPGLNATGKAQIRKAFEAIAAHFNHKLDVRQAGMKILETDDTALVLAKTIVSTRDTSPISRNATYVFRKNPAGHWLCVIDNSYGHELFPRQDA